MATLDTPIGALFGRRALLSLEFFPPKTEPAGEELLKNAELIATHLHPDFVSITYGAGGTTSKLTYLYTQLLRQRFGWTVMPHLTCVGHSQQELLAIAESYLRMGVCNIMALRGDPPKGQANFVQHPNGCAHASQLVNLLKTEYPQLCLGVAGYPEKHPEAPDLATDIAHLHHKVNQGASFVTTQLFFSAPAYISFVQQCRQQGIRVPILPGLLPVLSLEQARKFCGFCGATLPPALEAKLAALPPEEQWRAGVEWTVQLTAELLAAGAPGVHLYILNRSQSLLELVRAFQERGLFIEKA